MSTLQTITNMTATNGYDHYYRKSDIPTRRLVLLLKTDINKTATITITTTVNRTANISRITASQTTANYQLLMQLVNPIDSHYQITLEQNSAVNYPTLSILLLIYIRDLPPILSISLGYLITYLSILPTLTTYLLTLPT